MKDCISLKIGVGSHHYFIIRRSIDCLSTQKHNGISGTKGQLPQLTVTLGRQPLDSHFSVTVLLQFYNKLCHESLAKYNHFSSSFDRTSPLISDGFVIALTRHLLEYCYEVIRIVFSGPLKQVAVRRLNPICTWKKLEQDFIKRMCCYQVCLHLKNNAHGHVKHGFNLEFSG